MGCLFHQKENPRFWGSPHTQRHTHVWAMSQHLRQVIACSCCQVCKGDASLSIRPRICAEGITTMNHCTTSALTSSQCQQGKKRLVCSRLVSNPQGCAEKETKAPSGTHAEKASRQNVIWAPCWLVCKRKPCLPAMLKAPPTKKKRLEAVPNRVHTPLIPTRSTNASFDN